MLILAHHMIIYQALNYIHFIMAAGLVASRLKLGEVFTHEPRRQRFFFHVLS